MIWYLLYPFRGTTEPPSLSANHPIRRAFCKHGTNVTKHWLAFILLSVATTVLVCYPVFFLYEDASSGFSKLPHHEWMSAGRFNGNPNTPVDVVIRQVWVHSSNMRALETKVLIDALHIQNAVLYGVFLRPEDWLSPSSEVVHTVTDNDLKKVGCDPDGHADVSWGYHSPLMYWNCSLAALKHDQDVIQTVVNQSTHRSHFNLTLRPSSVFAGKSFIGNKIIAADALVLTLFDLSATSHNSLLWSERLSNLTTTYPNRWSFYPEAGTMTRSQLYKFKFKPISTIDDLMLIALYVAMLVYVVLNLRETPRSVKSPLGLILTILIEMTVSVIASFTICAILGIDLGRIPQEVYPFVVLGIGPENMFRLMNGVLAYPPQTSTTLRISGALGDVGHLSLAATGQNLAILWLLHKVVSPGVQAFCVFAAAALIFDFFLHLIFFVAVLSVDVRRMELQDSIEKVNENIGKRRRSKAQKRYWLDALLQGQLPFSSRIAFPAVFICFILGLNIQFSDSDSLGRIIVQTLMDLRGQLKQSLPESLPAFAPSVNQARTPQTWLRLQNHKTAEEVIKFVKPNGHTIIARIYDPLAIVLKGSDRSLISSRSITLPFLWQNVNRHIYPFLLTIIFAIGVVTLLMQYLLWNEMLDDDDEGVHSKSSLAIKRLPHAHGLDVFRMAVSGKCHVLAVDYSRHTSIHYFNRGSQTWSMIPLPTFNLPIPFWPNSFLAIDDTGTYAAFANSDGWIAFWHMQQRKLIQFKQLPHWNQRPLVFQLISLDPSTPAKVALVVVLPDGQITMLNIQDKSEPINERILGPGKGSLSHGIIARTPNGIFAIVSSLHHGMYIITLSIGDTEILSMSDPRLLSMKNDRVKYLTAAPNLSIIAAVRDQNADLIDLSTRLLLHRISLPGINTKSLRVLHSIPSICQTCQSAAVRSISLVYTEFTTKDCVMKTFTAGTNEVNSSICLRPTTNSEGTCQGLYAATESNYRVTSPGQWEATNEQVVIGIRSSVFTDKSNVNTETNANSYVPISSFSRKNSASTSFLSRSTQALTYRYSDTQKLRPPQSRTPQAGTAATKSTRDSTDAWEVWSLSSTGEYDVAQLFIDIDTDLYVARAGLLLPLGKRSLAVALGNVIQVVTAGSERIEEMHWNDIKISTKSDGRRRRVIAR